MTTCAYSGGVLATDSQMTATMIQRVRKGKRLPDGSLMAGSGDWLAGSLLEKWLIAGMPDERPKIPEGQEAEILIVRPSGQIETADQTFAVSPIIDRYMAIGSGAAFALGAMAMGASARTAVRIACRFDQSSSAPIHTIRFSKGVRQ